MDQGQNACRKTAEPEIDFASVTCPPIQPVDSMHYQSQRVWEQRVPQERPVGAYLGHPEVRWDNLPWVHKVQESKKPTESRGNTHEDRSNNGLKSAKPEIVGVPVEGQKKQRDPYRLQRPMNDPDITCKQPANPSADQEKRMEQKGRMR